MLSMCATSPVSPGWLALSESSTGQQTLSMQFTGSDAQQKNENVGTAFVGEI